MDGKLGLEEFTQDMIENISKMIINRNYIEENSNFFNTLFFKMYEDYKYSELNVASLNKYSTLLEIFLGSLLLEQPSLELPEDSI